jgi:hypothetical protein
MELLEELAAKAGNLILDIPLDLIEEDTIADLEQLLAKNQGKTTLKFILGDKESDMQIHMFSRTRGVLLSPELKGYLQKHSIINFSIN